MKTLLDNLHFLLTGIVRSEQSKLAQPITAFSGGLNLVLGWDRAQELPYEIYPAMVIEPYGVAHEPQRAGGTLVKMTISVDMVFRVAGKAGILYSTKAGAGILDAVTEFIAWVRANETLPLNGVPYTQGLVGLTEQPSVGTAKGRIGERYSNLTLTFQKVVFA